MDQFNFLYILVFVFIDRKQ